MVELNARSRCALNFAHPSSRTTVINLNPVIQHVGSVTERLTTWLSMIAATSAIAALVPCTFALLQAITRGAIIETPSS